MIGQSIMVLNFSGQFLGGMEDLSEWEWTKMGKILSMSIIWDAALLRRGHKWESR